MPERRLFFVTHADVVIDPEVPVPEWGLAERGRDRHVSFAKSAVVAKVKTVFSSAERKANEGAEILAEALGIPHHILPSLHENDRSSTGYLPKAAFEDMADAFFARPEESVQGWERAIDAQARIVAACQDVVARAPEGDIAIVAHGGVGTLLACHLRGIEIKRQADQPGRGGGNYLIIGLPEWQLLHDWQDIAPDIA